MMKMTDDQIVELYLARSQNAIAETSKKYGAKLRNLSYDIVKDSQTSEECENDTYLKTWQSVPPKDPRKHFFAYLAKIIRNVSLNCLRDLKRLKRQAELVEITSELEELIASPDDTECRFDSKLLAEKLNGFVKSLPDDKQTLFMRRYWFADSVSDISQSLGMSEANVKTTLCRIRKALKKHLENEGYIL